MLINGLPNKVIHSSLPSSIINPLAVTHSHPQIQNPFGTRGIRVRSIKRPERKASTTHPRRIHDENKSSKWSYPKYRHAVHAKDHRINLPDGTTFVMHKAFAVPKSASLQSMMNEPSDANSIESDQLSKTDTATKLTQQVNPTVSNNDINESHSSLSNCSSSDVVLPPLIDWGVPASKKVLNLRSILGMKVMNAQDPSKWSIISLAEHFQVSESFVAMCLRKEVADLVNACKSQTH